MPNEYLLVKWISADLLTLASLFHISRIEILDRVVVL